MGFWRFFSTFDWYNYLPTSFPYHSSAADAFSWCRPGQKFLTIVLLKYDCLILIPTFLRCDNFTTICLLKIIIRWTNTPDRLSTITTTIISFPRILSNLLRLFLVRYNIIKLSIRCVCEFSGRLKILLFLHFETSGIWVVFVHITLECYYQAKQITSRSAAPYVSLSTLSESAMFLPIPEGSYIGLFW